MKKSKRFRQSYRDTINRVIASHKEYTPGWTNKRIAYALDLGEMFEWSNDLLSSAWIWK